MHLLYICFFYLANNVAFRNCLYINERVGRRETVTELFHIKALPNSRNLEIDLSFYILHEYFSFSSNYFEYVY